MTGGDATLRPVRVPASGSFVFRIDADNIDKKIPVEVGDSTGGFIGTIGPLKTSNSVVVRGAEILGRPVATRIIISESERSHGPIDD